MGKYTLIIAEKPDAAKRIAMALDVNGNATKNVEHGVPFYRAFRNGDIIVVPSLGHLYTVASKEKTAEVTQFLITVGFPDTWLKEGHQEFAFGLE